MRHRKSFNHLGRTTPHRKAMLSNMATSLIMTKRITTTVAKAKALRSYVEPLLSKAKEDSTHSRRVVFSHLQDKDAVSELFREISPKIADRPGGYTRIIKLGNRLGDNAEMAIIELVDYNENLVSDTSTAKTTTRRRRKSSAAGQKPVEKAPEAPVAAKDELIEDVEVVEETTEDEAIEVAEEVSVEDVVAEAAAEVAEEEVAEEEKSDDDEEVKKES